MVLDALVLGITHGSGAWLPLAFAFLPDIADAFGGIILLVIGALIIIVLVAAAIVFLPAILVAVLVWFVTGSFFFAGIAFVGVAVLGLVAMADD